MIPINVMKQLTEKSAEKLQRILSKRFGRTLTRQELDEAYIRLMEFATALVDLYPAEHNTIAPPEKTNTLHM